MEVLTVPEAAARLGISETGVRTMLKDGVLLALRRDGALVLPEGQFDGEVPVKHLSGVLTLLRDARFTDAEALEWLTTPDDSLPGTPLQALHENRATEVKRRAQALL